MNVAFTLTMPGVGSWNGKWSGEGNLYSKIVKIGDNRAKELDGRSFHYHWQDGWSACVDCKIVDGSESRKIRKHSQGFYGYDWMIDSILFRDKILASHEIHTEAESKGVTP